MITRNLTHKQGAFFSFGIRSLNISVRAYPKFFQDKKYNLHFTQLSKMFSFRLHNFNWVMQYKVFSLSFFVFVKKKSIAILVIRKKYLREAFKLLLVACWKTWQNKEMNFTYVLTKLVMKIVLLFPVTVFSIHASKHTDMTATGKQH